MSIDPTVIHPLLTQKINSLENFRQAAVTVVEYMEENTQDRPYSTTKRYSHYFLPLIKIGGRTVQVRPLNSNLFIWDPDELEKSFLKLVTILGLLKVHQGTTQAIMETHDTFIANGGIERVLYTLQQAVACGLDLFTSSQFARKNVGTRFEDLIECVWKEMGVTYGKSVGVRIALPSTDDDELQSDIYYSQEADFIISPFETIQTTPEAFHPAEIIVSTKTTSKDRTPPIFLAKLFLSRALGTDVKTLAIFLTDIQRSGDRGISNTFVPNSFLIYTNYVNRLEGVYHIDPPPHIDHEPWDRELARFRKLLLEDLWEMGITSHQKSGEVDTDQLRLNGL